jgi:hypothetical protein
MRLPAVALTALAFASSCATATRDRSFARADLPELGLRSLEVAVVIAGPPRAAGVQFAVPGFEPVDWSAALAADVEAEPRSSAAVGAAIGSHLASLGFEARVKVWGVTSSAAVGSLEAGASARSLAEGASSDAVLVVRAVPVDEWFVDLSNDAALSVIDPTTTAGGLGVGARWERRTGRLLVGQAFLFDRRTGVRLWSRNAPDYPASGRLSADHPFLRYGHVGPSEDPARAAATPFVTALLAGLPSARDGSAEARARLDAVDREADERALGFSDAAHVWLELGAGWGLETASADIALADVPLPSPGTGALAPAGSVRGTLRIGALGTDEWSYVADLSLGVIPNRYGVVVHRDRDGTTPASTASLVLDGGTVWGAAVSAGPSFRLASRLLLVVRAGVLAESWTFGEASSLLVDGGQVRLGALAGADLHLLSSYDGPFYVRLGGEGRLGLAVGQGAFGGFAFQAGAGVLF